MLQNNQNLILSDEALYETRVFSLFLKKLRILDDIPGLMRPPTVLLYPDLSGTIRIDRELIVFDTLKDGIIEMEMRRLEI